MRFIIILLSLILTSCSLYTEITYNLDKKDEYIREDGFMLKCQKDEFSYGDVLLVSTFTPESWSEGFYYGYLNGKKSELKLKIIKVELLFIETQDTLSLKEIQKDRVYVFTSKELKKIIKTNKHLRLTVHLSNTETNAVEEKEFTLTRKKNSYLTGTFPHI
jgi:hypothetical protein